MPHKNETKSVKCESFRKKKRRKKSIVSVIVTTALYYRPDNALLLLHSYRSYEFLDIWQMVRKTENRTCALDIELMRFLSLCTKQKPNSANQTHPNTQRERDILFDIWSARKKEKSKEIYSSIQKTAQRTRKKWERRSKILLKTHENFVSFGAIMSCVQRTWM